MNILIDTHIILWLLLNDERLKPNVGAILSNINNNIFFSPLSIWEIELKHFLHKENFLVNTNVIYNHLIDNNFVELPLISDQVIKLKNIANKVQNHTDPFDRLLLTQAMSSHFYFLTHDNKFKNYDYNKLILI